MNDAARTEVLLKGKIEGTRDDRSLPLAQRTALFLAGAVSPTPSDDEAHSYQVLIKAIDGIWREKNPLHADADRHEATNLMQAVASGPAKTGSPRVEEFGSFGAYLEACHSYGEFIFGELAEKQRAADLDRALLLARILVPRTGPKGNYAVDQRKLDEALMSKSNDYSGKPYKIPETSQTGREIRRSVARDVAAAAAVRIDDELTGALGDLGPLVDLVHLVRFMLENEVIRA